MTDDALVFDATADTFARDVIARSASVPVLVDFWAAWCGPCRSLAPVLESVVQSYHGKVLLAKVDTDAEQALAAEHGIRSLPTVRLYRDGRVVSEFMGVQPESQIRAAIEPHLPRTSDTALSEGMSLAREGHLEEALAALIAARRDDADNPALNRAVAEVAAASGQFDQAREVLDGLSARDSQDEWVKAVRARLHFGEIALDAQAPETLLARLDCDPSDHESRYQLAAQYAVGGDFERAMEELLNLLKASRAFGDDAGRKGLLALFELLGDQHPLVGQFRPQMASALY